MYKIHLGEHRVRTTACLESAQIETRWKCCKLGRISYTTRSCVPIPDAVPLFRSGAWRNTFLPTLVSGAHPGHYDDTTASRPSRPRCNGYGVFPRQLHAGSALLSSPCPHCAVYQRMGGPRGDARRKKNGDSVVNLDNTTTGLLTPETQITASKTRARPSGKALRCGGVSLFIPPQPNPPHFHSRQKSDLTGHAFSSAGRASIFPTYYPSFGPVGTNFGYLDL